MRKICVFCLILLMFSGFSQARQVHPEQREAPEIISQTKGRETGELQSEPAESPPRINISYEKDDFEIINDESVINCLGEARPGMAFCAEKVLVFEVHVDCVSPDISLTALDLDTTKVKISSEYEPGSCEFEQILAKAEDEVAEQDADMDAFLDLKSKELQQKYIRMLQTGERCLYIKRQIWESAAALMREYHLREKIRQLEKGKQELVLNKC